MKKTLEDTTTKVLFSRDFIWHEIMFGRWQETLILEEVCVCFCIRDWLIFYPYFLQFSISKKIFSNYVLKKNNQFLLLWKCISDAYSFQMIRFSRISNLRNYQFFFTIFFSYFLLKRNSFIETKNVCTILFYKKDTMQHLKKKTINFRQKNCRFGIRENMSRTR